MSSVLATVARCIPKRAGLRQGKNVCYRVASSRSARSLTTVKTARFAFVTEGVVCGPRMCQPIAPLPASITDQGSQRRGLSSEASNSNHTSEEGEHVSNVSDDSSAASDTAAATESSSEDTNAFEAARGGQPRFERPACMMMQMDSIPFLMSQREIHEWIIENSGVSPKKLIVPMRPPSSNRPDLNKGRAYVEVHSEDDISKIKSLQDKHIGDRQPIVHRLLEEIDKCKTVCIRGVRDMAHDELNQILHQEVGVFPKALRLVENVRENNIRGVAYAEFGSAADAHNALELDGTNHHGIWLNISLAARIDKRSIDRNLEIPPMETEKAVVIRGIPFSMVEDEVREFLKSCELPEDEIVTFYYPSNKRSGKKLGLLYLEFSDEALVQTALGLSGTYIGDRWIAVYKYDPDLKDGFEMPPRPPPRPPTEILRQRYPDLPIVLMSGLDFSKSEQDVRDYLAAQGINLEHIEEMLLPLHMGGPNNQGRIFMVVNDEDTYNRILELTGAMFDDRWLMIRDADQ